MAAKWGATVRDHFSHQRSQSQAQLLNFPVNFPHQGGWLAVYPRNRLPDITGTNSAHGLRNKRFISVARPEIKKIISLGPSVLETEIVRLVAWRQKCLKRVHTPVLKGEVKSPEVMKRSETW